MTFKNFTKPVQPPFSDPYIFASRPSPQLREEYDTTSALTVSKLISDIKNLLCDFEAVDITTQKGNFYRSLKTAEIKLNSIQECISAYFKARDFNPILENKSVSKAIHDVGHAINCVPIYVELNLEMLDTPDALPQIRKNLSTIIKALDNAGKNLSSILPGSEQSNSQEDFCIAKLLYSLTGTSKDLFNISVSLISSTPESTTIVHGNIREIEQLITNLLINARDATIGCNNEPFVRISFGRSGDAVFVSVRNEIPDPLSIENIQKIKRALDAKSSDRIKSFTTKPNGKGIGLSIIRDCAIKNNGNLVFDCTQTHVTIVFTLPVAKQ